MCHCQGENQKYRFTGNIGIVYSTKISIFNIEFISILFSLIQSRGHNTHGKKKIFCVVRYKWISKKEI